MCSISWKEEEGQAMMGESKYNLGTAMMREELYVIHWLIYRPSQLLVHVPCSKGQDLKWLESKGSAKTPSTVTENGEG